MLGAITDAVLMTDLNGAITYLNPAAERLTDWALAEARGRQLAVILPLIAEGTRHTIPDPVPCCLTEQRPIDMEAGVLLLRRDWVELPVGYSAAPVRRPDGTIAGLVFVVRDESERRRVSRRLSFEATHDALTGLLNRRGFEQRLTAVLGDLEGSHARHVLLYLDLDGFKAVNDTWGHQVGDDLLRHLGMRLLEQMREGDSVARIGGDEFAILLENCPPAQGRRIANTLRRQIGQCGFDFAGRLPSLSVSIGLVELVPGGGGLSAIMQLVDAECYGAKRAGGNRTFAQSDAHQSRRGATRPRLYQPPEKGVRGECPAQDHGGRQAETTPARGGQQ